MKKKILFYLVLTGIFILNSNTYLNAQLECDCSPNSDPYIIDGTMQGGVNISTILPTIDWEVNCIILSGQLNIDVTAEIEFAEILCEPGSSIKILSDNKLTVKDSYFHGCTKMWKGIELHDATKLNISGSTIEDAEYAIRLFDECTLNSTNNYFMNNYIGIYAAGESTTYVIGPALNDCDFITNRYLKQSYDGSNVGYQLYSLAGIFLVNVINFNIGYPNTSDENVFRGLRNGIINVNSGVSIYNANVTETKLLFNNIDSSNPNKISGVAFYSLNNLFTNIYNSTTDKIQVAVCAINSNIEVIGNPFINSVDPDWDDGGGYGIYLFDCWQKNIEIKDNQFTGYWRTAIWANDINSTASKFEVINNKMNSMLFYDCDYASIKDNYDIYGTCYLQNVDNFDISYNLFPNDTSSGNKARIIGGGDNTFSYNELYSGLWCEAIDLEVAGSDGNIIECNQFNRSVIGVYFLGTNFWTDFKSNSLNDCYKSIVIHEGEIGYQRYKGNVFKNADNVGVIEGNNPYSIVDHSKFYFNPLDPPFEGVLEPPSYDPADIDDRWFIGSYEKNNDFCEDGVSSDTTLFKPWWKELSCDSISTLLDSTLFTSIESPFKNSFIWQKQRYIFKYMKQDSLLRDTCGWVDSILTVIYGDTIDKYVEIDIELDKANEISQMQKDQLSAINSQISILSSQINVLDSLMVTDTIHFDMYLLQKNDLVEQLRTIALEYNSLFDILDTQRSIKLYAVLASIDRLDASTLYEVTQKRYWQLKLKEMMEGIDKFTKNEIEELRRLASQCPLEAGKAVYGVRSLYMKFDSTVEYDDIDLCDLNKSSKLFLKNSNITEENNIEIYPNPTKDYWNVIIPNEKGSNVNIEIVDLKGEVINNFNLGMGKRINDKIFINGLPEGIYFAKFYYDNILKETVKLIKVK